MIDWKLIDETTPKPGPDDSVLLYEPFQPTVCEGYWSEDYGWYPRRDGAPPFWKQPTHWAPLNLPKDD